LKKKKLKRFSKKFKLEDLNLFRDKLLKWSNKFTYSSFLNSNNYSSNIKQYECICAVELESEIPFTKNNSTQKLDNYLKKVDDWVFGYLNYDLKNEIENLKSNNPDNFNLPNLYFYQPKKIWIIKNDYVEALYLESNLIIEDWNTINSLNCKNENNPFNPPTISQKINK
jgi:para-aminobenzoate synthetase component 1